MSYPNITTPTPSANEIARRADAETQRQTRRRAIGMQGRILDAFDHILDELTHQQTTRALAAADERRQFVNMLCGWKVCDKAACRRRQSCQGEPADCLRVLLPAIGLDKAWAHLIERRQRPKKARSRAT